MINFKLRNTRLFKQQRNFILFSSDYEFKKRKIELNVYKIPMILLMLNMKGRNFKIPPLWVGWLNNQAIVLFLTQLKINLKYITMTLLSAIRQPGWKGVWGRMGKCIWMAVALGCSPETVTTLLTGYTPTQNKKLKKYNTSQQTAALRCLVLTGAKWSSQTLTCEMILQ